MVRRETILVLGELAVVDEPTPRELQSFHDYPHTLDPRRLAEIAAWIDQVRNQWTRNDRWFLRSLRIADGDGAA
jgi:hypothetical protein